MSPSKVCSGAFLKSTFSSLYCLTSSIPPYRSEMHVGEYVQVRRASIDDHMAKHLKSHWQTAPLRMNTYYTGHPTISIAGLKSHLEPQRLCLKDYHTGPDPGAMKPGAPVIHRDSWRPVRSRTSSGGNLLLLNDPRWISKPSADPAKY